MSAPSAFLAELLAVKKQQATEVFGPWDADDEGRINVRRVRPLLLSVFPEAHDAPPFLTLSRVKSVYESVTQRPWQAPVALTAAAATSSLHARRRQDPMYAGPTLDEVHRIIDALAAGEGSAPQQQRIPSSTLLSTTTTTATRRGSDPLLSLSASVSLRGAAPLGDIAAPAEKGVVVHNVSAESCLRLLRGSLEQMHRSFCAASVAADEPVPSVLPTDAAHLDRLNWAVAARHLRFGEAHALQLLLATETGTREGTLGTKGDPASGISCDAFVKLVCVL